MPTLLRAGAREVPTYKTMIVGGRACSIKVRRDNGNLVGELQHDPRVIGIGTDLAEVEDRVNLNFEVWHPDGWPAA